MKINIISFNFLCFEIIFSLYYLNKWVTESTYQQPNLICYVGHPQKLHVICITSNFNLYILISIGTSNALSYMENWIYIKKAMKTVKNPISTWQVAEISNVPILLNKYHFPNKKTCFCTLSVLVSNKFRSNKRFINTKSNKSCSDRISIFT